MKKLIASMMLMLFSATCELPESRDGGASLRNFGSDFNQSQPRIDNRCMQDCKGMNYQYDYCAKQCSY